MLYLLLLILLGLGRNDQHVNIMNTTISNFPTSMMTPSPSPDELIIQQRGRRKIPVTFSPDIDAIKQVFYFQVSLFNDYNLYKNILGYLYCERNIIL